MIHRCVQHLISGIFLAMIGISCLVNQAQAAAIKPAQASILIDLVEGVSEALAAINFDSTDPKTIKNIGEMSRVVHLASLMVRAGFTKNVDHALLGAAIDGVGLTNAIHEIRACHQISQNNKIHSKDDTNYAKKVMLARIVCYTMLKMYMHHLIDKTLLAKSFGASYALYLAKGIEYLSKSFRYDVEFGYKNADDQLISDGFNDKYLAIVVAVLLATIYYRT